MAKQCYFTANSTERIRCELSRDYCLTRPIEAVEVAEICACEFYHFYKGDAEAWPVTITLYKTRYGPEHCRVEVHKETKPVFVGAFKF